MQRAKLTEANKSDYTAVVRVKHSSKSARLHQISSPAVLRMPAKYTTHDVEVLLDALWAMFTESQARKFTVLVPWDDSDEPQHMPLADLAALLESWIA